MSTTLVSEGRGYLGFVIPFGTSLGFNLAVGEPYWSAHRWPFACAMVLGGAVVYALGLRLNRDSAPRELFDPSTGRTVVLREIRRHRTFWMPLEWWGLLVMALGAFSCYLPVTSF